MSERPATCAACSKRLSKKSWYYRNGQFYCKKRCWVTASEKAKEAAAKAAAAKEANIEPKAEPKKESAEAPSA